MAVYDSGEQAGAVLRDVFTAVLAEEESAAKLRERQLSLYFVQQNPAVTLFVDADGAKLGEPPYPPTLRFEFDTDTADALWSGRTTITAAAVARRLRVKGPVSRIRQIADLLPAIGEHYGRLAPAKDATAQPVTE
jgi:putative sterol carrier protein